MNDPEKTQPLLAQVTSEQLLQEKPVVPQEHFPCIDEEQLEEVAGGGLPGVSTIAKLKRTATEAFLTDYSKAQKIRLVPGPSDKPNPVYTVVNGKRIRP